MHMHSEGEARRWRNHLRQSGVYVAGAGIAFGIGLGGVLGLGVGLGGASGFGLGLQFPTSIPVVYAMSGNALTASPHSASVNPIMGFSLPTDTAIDRPPFVRLMSFNDGWNAQKPHEVVSGQVFMNQGQGQPMANAVVSLGNASWGFASTTTDADGFYQFYDVPRGTYTVLAREAGSHPPGESYSSRSSSSSNLYMGEGTIVVAKGPQSWKNITLSEVGSAVSGVITNATNHSPMLGLVQIADKSKRVLWEGFTNLKGTFHTELPAGDYEMKVFVGNATYSQRLCLQPHVTTSVRAVVPMTAIMGTVENPNTPVVNAWVYCFDSFGRLVGRALTNIHGQYLVSGMVPGEYSIQVMKEGKTIRRDDLVVNYHVTTTANMVLR
jgi:hypothetical protein